MARKWPDTQFRRGCWPGSAPCSCGVEGEVKTALINAPPKQWGALLASVLRAFWSLAGISLAEGLHTLDGARDWSAFTHEGSESEAKRPALVHTSVGAGSVPSSVLGLGA